MAHDNIFTVPFMEHRVIDLIFFCLFQKLVYAQNSTAAEWWQSPPLSPQLRVYIFNYTNAEAYLNGNATQLEVEELGPYVYSEKVKKVDVKFHPNHTISYRVWMN